MVRIAYHEGGMQGIDLVGYCRDLDGVELIPEKTQEAFEGHAEDCDVLMLNTPVYTQSLAQRLAKPSSRVKWIQFASTGYDTALTHGVPPGVVVTNGGSIWAPSVAEHALAMLLALVRALPQAERDRVASRWDKAGVIPHLGSILGSDVGILGFGKIGQGIAERLKPFGARVTAITRTSRETPLADRAVTIDRVKDVLPELDVLITVLPLTAETRDLIGASWFERMKPSSIFISIGRGASVVEPELVQALRSKRIAAAGLDVAYKEPLVSESPLWQLENVLITPHVASLGGQGLQRLLAVCRENIERFIAGRPLRDQVLPI